MCTLMNKEGPHFHMRPLLGIYTVSTSRFLPPLLRSPFCPSSFLSHASFQSNVYRASRAWALKVGAFHSCFGIGATQCESVVRPTRTQITKSRRNICPPVKSSLIDFYFSLNLKLRMKLDVNCTREISHFCENNIPIYNFYSF